MFHLGKIKIHTKSLIKQEKHLKRAPAWIKTSPFTSKINNSGFKVKCNSKDGKLEVKDHLKTFFGRRETNKAQTEQKK